MDKENFLDGMSRVAATVSIVTTDGHAGRAGVTVSAMCSLSADRPSLLVCVHHLSPARQAIVDNGVFCVNTLRHDQAHIADAFAGRVEKFRGDKFACSEWQRLSTGAPALDDPLVAFDCTLMRQMEWGTHRVFIGDVVDIELTEGKSLIYANRSYGAPTLQVDALAAVA